MSSEDNSKPEGQPDTASAALFGLCPRCGAKTLFDGIARFAPRCRACSLDYTQFNVGAVIAILAIWVQLSFEPPFWVHAVLWVPLTTVMVIAGLRIAKAWLLIAEYRRRAGEGRLKDD